MDNDYVMISGILNSLRIRNSVVCRRFSGCSLYNDCRAESFVDKVCGTEKWVTHCLVVLKRFHHGFSPSLQVKVTQWVKLPPGSSKEGAWLQ